MKARRLCYGEVAYLIGILLLAMGTALMERADFGLSMVVAPAYLLHLYLSPRFTFFSFGMAEYLFQAGLLLLCGFVLRRFRLIYLGAFFTALLYGVVLDQMLLAANLLPILSFWGRLVCFLAGMLLGALGIAFFFHTELPPEAYELLVKELVLCYGLPISRVKTIYDCISCVLAIGMSFCFFGFGHFEGVKLGTIFCAAANGSLIGWSSKFLETHIRFVSCFPALEACIGNRSQRSKCSK